MWSWQTQKVDKITKDHSKTTFFLPTVPINRFIFPSQYLYMLDTDSSSYTSGKSQVSYICNFIKNLTPVPILFCFANPL